MTRPLAVFACVLGWMIAAPASAQRFSHDDFSALRFYVAPGSGNFLMVEGAETGPDGMPSFGATFDYAHRPFVADDLDCVTGLRSLGCAPMTQETDLLGPLLSLQLYGAITLFERLQIGLNVPAILYFEGEGYSYLEDNRPRRAAPGGSGAGLGDPRLSAKLRLLDPESDGNGFSFAVSAWVTAPIAHYTWPGQFLGDRYPAAGGQVIGSFRHDGLRVALNLGVHVREEAKNVRSAVGPEMVWGAAAAYRFHPLFEALVEATGATSFGQRFDSEAPTELRAAALVHLGELSLHAGGGAGLFYGVGVPIFRAFLGASFTPQPDLDSDGDGIPDSLDACPADPEDFDGFADEDGCPDPDNDGDGIPDGYDSCPDTPEDFDGDRDEDGCPDDDKDGDGIPDDEDECPDEPEDFDGLADEDGCPEDDADEDGIPDDEDECPDEPGTAAHGGCPPGGR